jgi:hypothetical protein
MHSGICYKAWPMIFLIRGRRRDYKRSCFVSTSPKEIISFLMMVIFHCCFANISDGRIYGHGLAFNILPFITYECVLHNPSRCLRPSNLSYSSENAFIANSIYSCPIGSPILFRRSERRVPDRSLAGNQGLNSTTPGKYSLFMQRTRAKDIEIRQCNCRTS